jgi:uncharacterized repeat protein (TIGR03803 family)
MAVTALLWLCTVGHAASNYRVILNFNSTDGELPPTSGVTIGANGSLYGTAGGGTGSCPNGCGVVFRLSPEPSGKWTGELLYTVPASIDGYGPNGGVTLGPNGTLFGTTQAGGAHEWGTVWKLTPHDGSWSEKVLFSFPGNAHGGAAPFTRIVVDPSGNLFGTAGIAYELERADHWQESVLYNFKDEKYGSDPAGSLIMDSTGNLYGTTYGGGNRCSSDSTCGTVYELSPQADGSWKHIVLFKFNGKDGQFPGPGAPLYMDKSGALYGTTDNGGTYDGVIFRLTPGRSGHWTYKVLYDFREGSGGNGPDAGVVMDKLGNLYGTTDSGGGPNGCGTLYKLAPVGGGKWEYSVLHTFGRVGDGCLPGNLSIDQHGNLYGSAIFGGKYGYGVIFEYSTLASSR